MKQCQYYAFQDGYALGDMHACSQASVEYPLVVNCTGNVVMTEPFTTYNGTGRQDYYLIYMEQGTLDVDMPNGACTVGEGQVILFPPGYHYRYTYRANETLSYLWVHFTGAYAEELLKDCGLDLMPYIHNVSCGAKLIAGFHKLFEIFESGGRLQRQMLACTLEQLLLNLAAGIGQFAEERTLERSLNRIHSCYDRELRIPELARMESLSHSRYITLFQKRTGYSPTEYIIHLRMNAACDLLLNTDMSVKQIAVAVGYDDPHFFSKLFKKKLGKSPLAYRNGE